MGPVPWISRKNRLGRSIFMSMFMVMSMFIPMLGMEIFIFISETDPQLSAAVCAS
jgi:hypothetical protein